MCAMHMLPAELPKDPLDRAIALVGSPTALADAVGVSLQAVSKWRKNGQVPTERCAAVEKACKGLVTRAELRPDHFGEIAANEDAPDPDADRVVPPEETA